MLVSKWFMTSMFLSDRNCTADPDVLRETIVKHANNLQAARLPRDQVRAIGFLLYVPPLILGLKVGIQFVQIGNSSSATKFLTLLDDKLSYSDVTTRTEYLAQRDIVDTTKYEAGVPLTAVRLLKILLGGIDKRRDNMYLRQSE